jgi:hypothetical protein
MCGLVVGLWGLNMLMRYGFLPALFMTTAFGFLVNFATWVYFREHEDE